MCWLEPGEWLHVYLLRGLAYLKQSSVPAVLLQPSRPASTRWRISSSYQIITTAGPNLPASAPTGLFTERNVDYVNIHYNSAATRNNLPTASWDYWFQLIKQHHLCEIIRKIYSSLVCFPLWLWIWTRFVPTVVLQHRDSEQNRSCPALIQPQPTIVTNRHIFASPLTTTTPSDDKRN